MNEDIFKKKLFALLVTFADRPAILLNYLIKYNALNDEFKERIYENEQLDIALDKMQNGGEEAKQMFKNLEEMQRHFNAFFKSTESKQNLPIKHPILGAETNEEALKRQLEEAIENEDYEEAAKIRDYMNSQGYDTDINL